MLKIIQACGHTYLHVEVSPHSPILSYRLDGVRPFDLPDLLARARHDVVISLSQIDHPFCKQCGKPVLRRQNEGITNYRKRVYCSKQCAGIAALPSIGLRRIRRTK